ncbi:MAG: 4Fe-4S dicluster domain-containing protein [Pirellulales bacterium]|nr:4Fe-4S dicluster domain-containing protein [Pirellulales bacterium]
MIEKLLFQAKPPAASSKQTKRSNQITSNQALDEGLIDPDFMEFLVQERFVNGSATMLINMDRCTRCDDCVRACASTHDNNPRFLRQGPTHGNIMVARSCMHCQDPVCMIECPTGAISRELNEGEVSINDTTCIGCGACSKNCPYEAIRMVEIRDNRGLYIRAVKDQKPITKATKCDLCVDQHGGPACQNACPHDALARIDMGDVVSLAAWLDQ